jgi:hypothetical protein
MKSSFFLLAGVAATLSLASCSSNSTTETSSTTTPADSTGSAMKTTTTRTYSDTDYHTRGDRMAARFASANKISDQATLAKLKTAYYNRAKRYDEMMTKFQADTAGMAAAKRDYMKANDQEFQTILVVPAQYQAYQSSYTTPDYDESSNLDIDNQTDAASSATMPSDSSSSMSSTSSTSTSTTTTSDMGSGAAVEKGKTKLTDGTKIKVKDDGKVKLKDADGNKTKM